MLIDTLLISVQCSGSRAINCGKIVEKISFRKPTFERNNKLSIQNQTNVIHCTSMEVFECVVKKNGKQILEAERLHTESIKIRTGIHSRRELNVNFLGLKKFTP